MEAITEFRGEYHWLSNNWFLDVMMPDGILYQTSQHAYQAQKTLDLVVRRQIAGLPGPCAARKNSCNVVKREDWKQVKLTSMEEAARRKFLPGTPLAMKLLETGNTPLLNRNNYNDKYWGVCQGKGLNHLGKILMKIREELTCHVPKSSSSE